MIIGVGFRARTGKDTFAEMLAEELYNITKYKFILMAYAHELKLRVQQDFDMSYEQLWGNEKEVPDERYLKNEFNGSSIHWTPREIMQAYGQFYRTINYNFWVEHLFNVIEEKEYKNVIITDVRHPNEADAIANRDGFIIKVNRVGTQEIHGANHISETAMDNYDRIDFDIENNGTLDDLRNSAKNVAIFLTNNKLKFGGLSNG